MTSLRRAPRRLLAVIAVVALAGPAAAAAPAPTLAPDIPAGCGVAPLRADAAVLAGVEPRALPRLDAVVRRLGGRIAGGVPRLSAVEIELGSPADVPEALATLGALPGVRWVERERVVRGYRTPNDPYRDRQWGLRAVSAYGAWDHETGHTTSVTVAILDTGIDLAHPDLGGRVTDGPNQFGGSTSHDDHGHGTHVAGIVGATTNNRRGVAGMSWGARLLAVKVLDRTGVGTDCSVINGYFDAVEAGAKVVNMSLGASGNCPVLYRLAFEQGARDGVVSVAAAGNSGHQGNPVESPASCPGVIAVAAVDVRGKAAPFSGHHDYVAVAAPGVDVLSTHLDPRRDRHGYARFNGTSMATPFVAGLAALLLSKHPAWTPQQVRDRITATARDLGEPGPDEFYGAGRIDAARALG